MNVQAGLHGVQRAWERLSLAQRLATVPYAVLALSALAPWVRGEPFMNGFMGAEEQPPTVSYGWEAAWPVFAIALVGILALLWIRQARVRRLSQLAVWGILALPELVVGFWGEVVCLLCENSETLWGFDLFRAAAFVGLAVALYDVVQANRDRFSS